jgi:hypothetical protein
MIYCASETEISEARSTIKGSGRTAITEDIVVGDTGGDFVKLSGTTGALQYIRTNGLGANIKIILNESYNASNETFPIGFFNTLNTSNYTITICPGSDLSITVNSSEALFKFENAKNIIIDGRINASGEGQHLELINSNTGAPVIKFLNNAHNDTLRYLKIKGNNSSYSSGLIHIQGVSSSYSAGNSYITIDHCDIGKADSYPTLLIYSSGTINKENNYIQISNNRLHDFSNITVNCQSSAIMNAAYGNFWKVFNNHIYQTSPVQFGSLSSSVYTSFYGLVIFGGGGHEVYNNYIGGNSDNCEGLLEITSGSLVFGYGMEVDSKTYNSRVENNTIRNIKINNNYSGESFSGITGSSESSAGITIKGNKIENIESISSQNNNVIGIKLVCRGSLEICNNTIDSLSSRSTNNNKYSYCHGIYETVNTSQQCVVKDNNISNLRSGTSSSLALNKCIAIYHSATNGFRCHNNQITDLQIAGGSITSYISGVELGNGLNRIYNNMISIERESDFPGRIYGMYDKAGTNSYHYNSVNLYSDANPNSGYSCCFYSENNSAVTREIKNNIFCNRISGYSLNNYGISLVQTDSTYVKADYNNYYSELTGYNNQDYTSLEAWKTGSSLDQHSKSFNPAFVSNTDLHINPVGGNTDYVAIPVSDILTDFDEETRSVSQPFIGSDERPEGLTLPVELSLFSCSLECNNSVKLEWHTESESNLLGYHLYRAEQDNFSSAARISEVMIPARNLSNLSIYKYNDKTVTNHNKYYYWLISYELNGSTNSYGPLEILVEISSDNPGTEIYLTNIEGFYPNPCNSRGNFSFTLSDRMSAELKVYNSKGQLVKVLFKGMATKGRNTIEWDCKNKQGNRCSSGVYLFQLNTGNYSEVRKLLLLK